MPPIFEPEVAAEAILFAASHRRRNVPVGSPTWKAEWGQKFFPGLLDRCLGRTAYRGQQTDETDAHDHPDNLFQPVAGDPGTRGAFTRDATARSPALWVEKHRSSLALGILAAGAVVAAAWLTGRSPRARMRIRGGLRYR